MSSRSRWPRRVLSTPIQYVIWTSFVGWALVLGITAALMTGCLEGFHGSKELLHEQDRRALNDMGMPSLGSGIQMQPAEETSTYRFFPQEKEREVVLTRWRHGDPPDPPEIHRVRVKKRYNSMEQWISRVSSTTAERVVRVCIISLDAVGPVRNGGIGTFTSALAEWLARDAAFEVTLLFGTSYTETEPLEYWQKHYERKGVRFRAVERGDDIRVSASEYQVISYGIMQHLQGEWKEASGAAPYDVIITHEWCGPTYYTQLAMWQGAMAPEVPVIVVTHSSTMWQHEGAHKMSSDSEFMSIDYMEREVVKHAHAVVSPSHYLLQWMEEMGWQTASRLMPRAHCCDGSPEDEWGATLPCRAQCDRAVVVQLNPLLPDQLLQLPSVTSSFEPRNGDVVLVFFGRLVARKGLVLFCDAVSMLAELGVRMDVLFLGKEQQSDAVGPMGSLQFIRRESSYWTVDSVDMVHYDTDTTRSSAEALALLKSLPGAVAVMPSIVENSPYTVLECLEQSIPFISTNVGGIAEMLRESDVSSALCEPNAPGLARAMLSRLDAGPQTFTPLQNREEPVENWRTFVKLTAALHPTSGLPAPPRFSPLVSVGIITRNRPQLLEQAVRGIRQQTYANLEVIVVDDASYSLEHGIYNEIQQYKSWRLIRNAERMGDGVARNIAASHAMGAYLIFVDDDNIPKSDMIERMVRAAKLTGCDIIGCMLDAFESDDWPREDGSDRLHQWLPLGADVAGGMYHNTYGDTNALIRRAAFVDAGGFSSHMDVGFTDWEFFAHAVGELGYTLTVMPLPLLWYRVHQATLRISKQGNRQAGHMRVLEPYVRAAPNRAAATMYAKSVAMNSDSTLMLLASMGRSSARDFGGNQGEHGWFYGYSLDDVWSGRYRFVMFEEYDEQWERWTTPRLSPHLHLSAVGGHPAFTDSQGVQHDIVAIRRWRSNRRGVVQVHLTFGRPAHLLGKGDGVVLGVVCDGAMAWRQHVSPLDTHISTTTLFISTDVGSCVDCVIGSGGSNDWFDTINMAIELLEQE